MQYFFVIEISILPSPSSFPIWLNPPTVTSYYQDFSQTLSTVITSPKVSAWLLLKTLKKKTKFLSSTNANSPKAAIFHTMAFKMSLKINNDKVTIPTKRSYLKVLYIVCRVKKKNINFEQYARIHLNGPKIAICETASDTVFVLNSSFTTKDNYFRAAIEEACEAFNKMMQEFGYAQKREIYDPHKHPTNPPQQHPLY